MVHPIKVTIGGREYSLYGDDESTIKESAQIVDEQLREIKKNNENESINTLTILAALNIAEKFNKNRQQLNVDYDYLMIELNKMAEFLKSYLN